MELPFPKEFLERLSTIVPPDRWENCLASFQGSHEFSLRINPLRAEPDNVRDELLRMGIVSTSVPWMPDAQVIPIEFREPIVASPLVTTGQVYVQNLSSMLAVSVLGGEPHEQILDLAAAPGGKTIHLAACMKNLGWLSAVEPIRGRFYKLQANLRLYGVTIGHTYLTDGRTVGHKTPDRFDRVLLDAPCSGEARFRTDRSESYRYWSLRKIREQSRKQKGLLRSALQAAKPGGRILYCTCSFAPEENEYAIDHLVTHFPHQVRILPLELPIENWQVGLTHWQGRDLAPDVSHARRVLPVPGMDAFFLCLLEKRSDRTD